MTDLDICRRRMHGLYLSRECADITVLARELMGMHCWFHRNVVFSALIRGADIRGWKTALTKTWLYRGTLHGVSFDDLPTLLALHAGGGNWIERQLGKERIDEIAARVVALMEDGVYSRAEMRRIFFCDYDKPTIDLVLSPWGGIFVELARRGLVAFRNMASRDFDLISAEPTRTPDDVLPGLLRRYFTAYGPATLADAAWFFGFWKDDAKKLKQLPLDGFTCFEHNKSLYYYVDDGADMRDIPEITLLSGFDPIIVSYVERSAVLPAEYKSKVVLKSGICLPTVVVNGKVAGLWNIKKNEPVVEMFEEQPAAVQRKILDLADSMRWRVQGHL